MPNSELRTPNSERIILGIDPGTNIMGYAIIKIFNSNELRTTHKNNNILLITLDVIKLSNLKNQALKLKSIFEASLSIINEYKPDELSIEAPFFGKNIQSMLKLGRAQGVAMAAALYRDIPIFEYSPRKIKQSITGKGSASKEQVAAMLANIFIIPNENLKSNIVNRKLPLDATDALAVAVCHYFQKQTPNSELRTTNYTGWKAFISQNLNRLK